MIKDNRYSIRKTKIAVGSVLIASFLAAGAVLPSNNNIVKADETVMVPRPDNIHETVEGIEVRDNKLFIKLQDNIEYKSGDKITFSLTGTSITFPSSGPISILNTDTGDQTVVGSLSAPKDFDSYYSNSLSNLAIEEKTYLGTIGLEEYSKLDRGIELIKKLVSQAESLATRQREVSISLNENINTVNKDRTLVIPFSDVNTSGEKEIFIRMLYGIPSRGNPIEPLGEIRWTTNSINEELIKYAEEVESKSLREVSTLKFDDRILVEKTKEIPYNVADFTTETIVNYPPSSPRETTYGVNINNNYPNYNYLKVEPQLDPFLETLNYSTPHYEIRLTPENGDEKLIKDGYTINPGDINLELEFLDSWLTFDLENIPTEIETVISGYVSGRAGRNGIISANSKLSNILTSPAEVYSYNSPIKFSVEKVSENKLVLKNTTTHEIPANSPGLRVDTKLYPLAIYYEHKENWNDYLDYDTMMAKNVFKTTAKFKEFEEIVTHEDDPFSMKDFGWGENTRGTVKVRFEDESGNAIPNKPERTLIDNQIWRTKYSINTAEETPAGYAYVGLKTDSKPLAGIAGDGERIVTLVFKKNVQYIADPKLPKGTTKPNGDGTQIFVGTASDVVELDFTTIEQPDNTKPVGYREVITPGKKGSVTTPYTLGANNEPVPGTPVRVEPVTEVVKVGVGQETPIPKGVRYEADPTKPAGEAPTIKIQGKDGVRNPDGSVKTPAEDDVYSVPSGNTVKTNEIPFKTITNNNDKLPEGETRVVQEGENGIETITTTYTVDPTTGKLTESVGKPVVTKAPKDKIVEVGTGKNQSIPFETEYVADPTLEAGDRVTDVTGVPGVVDVTGKVLTPPTKEVIRVGTKTKVDVIPHGKDTEEVPDKPLTYKEVIPGKDGKTEITYTLDPKTGEITPNENVTPAVPEITKVGTGPNSPIPAEVIYEADPTRPEGERETIPGTDGLKDFEGAILKEPTPTIIKVGTKVDDKEIPFEKTTVYDPELPDGETKITTVGVPGVIKTTITVDPKTGKETRDEKVTDPVTEVTTIGRKPIYTEEWIGDPFAGDKDKDAEIIVSQDIVTYDYKVIVNVDGINEQTLTFDDLTPEQFISHLEALKDSMRLDPRNLIENGFVNNDTEVTLNYKSPDEYKEEWIGDPFAGDKDNDAEVIVSNDVVYDQEWIDDPYVTDHPEINNYTIIVSVDGITEQTLNFDGITEEAFNEHLTAIKESVKQDPRKLIENGVNTNGNTITLNFKSPDEYKEEWIGDPFVGDKDKDAGHIVSVDKIIEDSKKEEPMPEKPKEETPVKEVPKVETPKAETPKAEEVKKEEKKLPNTGTDDSSSMLAVSTGFSLLGLVGMLFKRKRKED